MRGVKSGLIGYFYALLDIVAIQVGAVLALFITQVIKLPQLETMALETLLGPLLFVVFGWRKVARLRSARDLWELAALVGLSVWINATVIISLTNSGVATTAALELVGNVTFTVAVDFYRTRKIGRLAWSMVALAGVLFFVQPWAEGATSLWVIGVGFLCGVGFGVRIWVGPKLAGNAGLKKQVSSVLSAGPLLAGAALLGGLSAGDAPLIEVAALVLVMGVVNTALPLLLEILAGARISEHRIALVLCTGPVVGALASWMAVRFGLAWVQSSPIGLVQWASLVLIVIGAIAASAEDPVNETVIRWEAMRVAMAHRWVAVVQAELPRARARADLADARNDATRARLKWREAFRNREQIPQGQVVVALADALEEEKRVDARKEALRRLRKSARM